MQSDFPKEDGGQAPDIVVPTVAYGNCLSCGRYFKAQSEKETRCPRCCREAYRLPKRGRR